MTEFKNFGEYILAALRSHPERVLLRHAEDLDDYKSYMGHEIESFIMLRLSMLTKKSQHAVVLIPFGIDHISWLIALQLRGIASIYYPKKDLLRRLLFGKRLSVVLPENAGLGLRFLLVLIGHRVIRIKKLKKAPVPIIDHQPKQSALISYSSGTSSKAKKIRRSHEVLIQQHFALKKAFPPQVDQVDYPLFPNVVLHNLACGVLTVVPGLNWNEWDDFFPGDILDQLRRFDVTTLTGNLHYFLKLMGAAQHLPSKFEQVKAVGIGGSPIPDWLLDDMQVCFPNAIIYVIYGSTEAEPIAIRPYRRQRNTLYGYCVGKAHPDIHLSIKKMGELDVQDSSHDWGEIVVNGPHVIQRNTDGANTSDLGYLHDGELFLIGRMDNQAAHQGYFPYQLEHYLNEEVELEDVAIINDKEHVWVFYTSQEDLKEEIHVVLNQIIDNVRVISKRLQELPKDARHHSKTIYSKLYADHLSGR